MTHKLILVVLFFCILQLGQCIVYPSVSHDGFEVIHLDKPSFLSSLHHSYSDETLYIFGEDELRLVNTGKNFSAQDHPAAIEWNQPFVSMHVFHVGTDLWAVGPTLQNDYTAYTEGYELPLALTGPGLYQTQQVDELQGYLLYNLYTDESNLNDVISYMVGWIPVYGGYNESVNQVSFGVVRVHININLPFAERKFTFNYARDVVHLTYNQFTIYTPHYKPHVHYQNSTNILIVVDPNNYNVHTIQVGPGTTAMYLLQTGRFHRDGTTISSTLFHRDTNLLYIGYAASGLNNGTIVSIDMGTLVVQHLITFNSHYLSNPRAIAIDEPTDTIYVGFSGGDVVLRLDYLLNIEGYQRVPAYLTHIEAARVGLEHVYFITNEQHSKVMRLNKTDFCTKLCPFNGYCSQGKCKCTIGHALTSDGNHCVIPDGEGKVTTDKGAAVALGVLFALTFVAAALGWVLYWRARKGGYTSV